MKKSSLITLAVCLASVIGVGPATAQTRNRIKLTLPYAVTVGTVTLPAGDCTITDIKDNGHETFFLIRSDAGPTVDVMMERTGESDNPEDNASTVQLRHVGNNYEIGGIRIDGRGYKVN
jgi:hypothetical protein